MEDPILYIGVDIGIKRDTSAVTAIYPNYDDHFFGLWGHKIFSPPVNMVKEVEPCLFKLLENQRVAAVSCTKILNSAPISPGVMPNTVSVGGTLRR